MQPEIKLISSDDAIEVLPPFLETFYEIGKKTLFENTLSYWPSVNVSRGDDGEVFIETLDRFFKKAVDLEKVPSWLSIDDYKKVFKEQIEELYFAKRKKAVEKFEEEG